MDEKIIKVFKIKMFDDKEIKLGMINNKLCYIGFEKDSIRDFFKNWKVRNVLKGDEFEKYINFLRKFEKKEEFEIDFNDLYFEKISDIQKLIFVEMCKLQYGQYLSYSDFAKLINKHDYTRFVAICAAKNPILLLIPCHRLISKNTEVKYRSGRENKLFLLRNGY